MDESNKELLLSKIKDIKEELDGFHCVFDSSNELLNYLENILSSINQTSDNIKDEIDMSYREINDTYEYIKALKYFATKINETICVSLRTITYDITDVLQIDKNSIKRSNEKYKYVIMNKGHESNDKSKRISDDNTIYLQQKDRNELIRSIGAKRNGRLLKKSKYTQSDLRRKRDRLSDKSFFHH